LDLLELTQRCTRCKEDLSHSEFSPSQIGKLGAWCRPCHSSYTRDRRSGVAPPRETDTCLWCRADISHLRAHARYCSNSCNARGWRRDNPGRHRALRIRSIYGIEMDEFDELLGRQGYACAICRTTEPSGNGVGWNIDHNHDTGQVRGILCPLCNQGLGQFRDDPAVLHAAIDYLLRTDPVHSDNLIKEKTA
jgi:hypothetical protein